MNCSNELLGFSAQQNPLVLSHLSELFQQIKPKLIIEFGTAKGGLSVCLSLY
jgi:cephalosporin hydroxylase